MYLDNNEFIYDGKEKKPGVIIRGLVKGVDYTVKYSNNIEARTGKVTITEIGLFTGSKDGKKTGEVSVVGLKKKSLKIIKIATKVTLDGITYKVTSIGKNAYKKY